MSQPSVRASQRENGTGFCIDVFPDFCVCKIGKNLAENLIFEESFRRKKRRQFLSLSAGNWEC